MVIIQKRVGQLCNQLFTIAHFTASAIENGYRVLCPCFEYPLQEFPNINASPNLKVIRAGCKMNRLVHGLFKVLRLSVPKSPLHRCYVADGIAMWLWWDFTFDERIIASIGMARIITRMLLDCRGFARPVERFVPTLSGVWD